MKKLNKRITAIFLSILIIFMVLPVSHANEDLEGNEMILEIDNETRNFIKKYQQIFKKFYFDDSGYLKLDLEKKDLISKYNFSENEAKTILNSVKYASPVKNEDSLIKERIHVSSGKIYFSSEDVTGLLFAAAQIGPAAIYGLLVGMGSTLGPVGTGLVAALGIIGAPSLASFTYNVIQAQVNNQGVYIGVEFNGIFPNIVQGIWSGK